MSIADYVMYEGLGGVHSAKDVEVVGLEDCPKMNVEESKKIDHSVLPPPRVFISINAPSVESKPSLNDAIAKNKKWLILAGVGLVVVILVSMNNKKEKKVSV